MQWYVKVLQNYAGFQGRARRTEYWMFALISAIIYAILFILQSAAHLSLLLTGLYSLAVFIPGLAVGARRLHDTGRTGLWLLIALIPFIGAIILLVFMCLDSQPDENQFGSVPK
jgi:uncharacterized membrane protein YhaH (DUF805 family)